MKNSISFNSVAARTEAASGFQISQALSDALGVAATMQYESAECTLPEMPVPCTLQDRMNISVFDGSTYTTYKESLNEFLDSGKFKNQDKIIEGVTQAQSDENARIYFSCQYKSAMGMGFVNADLTLLAGGKTPAITLNIKGVLKPTRKDPNKSFRVAVVV